MKTPINFDKVADIYDNYVKTDFDIPFFLKESDGFNSEILELMCGTGRVSIPLLESGRTMCCVDYSKGMLDIFREKITGKNYQKRVNLIEMDVTKLNIGKKFGLIFLPFHAISEILSATQQKETLKSISNHLEKGGTFILTLQNLETRLKQADGNLKIIGEFQLDNHRKMILSFVNQFNPDNKMVSGFQFYEIFDKKNIMIEKRYLEINFKPIEDKELREMILDTGLQITAVYGDYAYHEFDEKTSSFMIYKMTKN